MIDQEKRSICEQIKNLKQKQELEWANIQAQKESEKLALQLK